MAPFDKAILEKIMEAIIRIGPENRKKTTNLDSVLSTEVRKGESKAMGAIKAINKDGRKHRPLMIFITVISASELYLTYSIIRGLATQVK